MTPEQANSRQYQYEKACGNGLLDRLAKQMGITRAELQKRIDRRKLIERLREKEIE